MNMVLVKCHFSLLKSLFTTLMLMFTDGKQALT